MNRPTRYLDPRTKFLILIFINILVFSKLSFPLEITCVAFICLSFAYQGMWRSLIKAVIQYAVILLLNELLLYLPGMIAAMFGVLILVSRKLFPLLSFGKVLLASPVGEMIAALQAVHLPKQLIVALTVVIRFFPTMKEEYACIRDAMKTRGIPLNCSNVLRHPAATTEYILVPTIQRLSVVSDELSAAATTRGIDSTRPRTSYYAPHIRLVDWLFLICFVLLVAVCIAGQMGVIG